MSSKEGKKMSVFDNILDQLGVEDTVKDARNQEDQEVVDNNEDPYLIRFVSAGRVLLRCPQCEESFERCVSQTHLRRNTKRTYCSEACRSRAFSRLSKTEWREMLLQYAKLPTSPSGIRKSKGSVQELAQKYGISSSCLINYVHRKGLKIT